MADVCLVGLALKPWCLIGNTPIYFFFNLYMYIAREGAVEGRHWQITPYGIKF